MMRDLRLENSRRPDPAAIHRAELRLAQLGAAQATGSAGGRGWGRRLRRWARSLVSARSADLS